MSGSDGGSPDRSVCRNFRRLPGTCNCRNAGLHSDSDASDRFSARTRADGDFHCDGKSGWKPVVFLASYFSVKIPL